MNLTSPHYLLFAQVDRTEGTGRWRFVMRTNDGAQQFEAADSEPGLRGERLDLLTVVRALESLDQPSQVTLVDCSDYIWKGVQYGLPEWNSNGWQWEFFGQMVPVKNSDLWQRMDRALRFHEVECRRRRFDPAHRKKGSGTFCRNGPEGAAHKRYLTPFSWSREKLAWGLRNKLSDWLKYAMQVTRCGWLRRLAAACSAARHRVLRACWPRTAYP
jgi:ribonuclease HI